MRSFQVDVKRCETFARETVAKLVPRLVRSDGVQQPLIDSLFASVNQLFNMFFDSGWTDYISELNNVGAKKYSSVPPDSVYNLLTKIRTQDKKKKKRSEAVKRKFTGKKQPNPVKIALKAVEEHLQERQNPSHVIGSRLAMSDQSSPSVARTSPLPYRRGTGISNASTTSTNS